MNTSKKSIVAVIGLGNIGKVVATNLVKGNREVIVADKTISKAQDLSKALGSLVKPMEVSDAIKAADMVILSVWFSTIKEFLTQYAAELKGKIIIDPSNPIAPAEDGGFKKIIGAQESAGEILAGLLPDGVKLAKAFGSLGAATLESAAYGDTKSVLFYATNDTGINAELETLITDSGFEPIRIGTLDKSIRMEVFGDLHEFGALGKAVTAEEAMVIV